MPVVGCDSMVQLKLHNFSCTKDVKVTNAGDTSCRRGRLKSSSSKLGNNNSGGGGGGLTNEHKSQNDILDKPTFYDSESRY